MIRGGLVDRVGFFASRLAPTGDLCRSWGAGLLRLGLAELRGQFAQQDFGFEDFANHIIGFFAAQTDTLKQRVGDVFIRPRANPAAAQQAHGQANEVRVFGVGAVVAWVVLEAQGGGSSSGMSQ